MSKINEIFDVLGAGIKAEGVRQKAIANNVANIQTSGYRRIDVKFQDLLAQAMNSSGKIDLNDLESEVYHPNNTLVNSNGNDVSLEMEVGEMVKNSLRHKTLVRLLEKKYQQIDLAIDVK